MQKFSTLIWEEIGSVLVLKINRPESLNALNKTVVDELNLSFDLVNEKKEIKVVIISGVGEKSFVAGADIKEIDLLDAKSAESFAQFGQKVFRKIETCRVPVMAAVNGFALGGGLELALSCDFIYASETAKLGLPECNLGIMPGFGGTVRLARRISPAMAKELTLTGSMVTATEARELGLVNKVLPLASLMEESIKTAQKMANLGAKSLHAIKKSIDTTLTMSNDEAMKVEAKLFSELFTTEDQKEGTKAFIEKRKPNFKGI